MTEPLPILTQRRIEAAFAKGIYDEMAAPAPGGVSSLDAFRAVLPRWTAEDALAIDVLRSTDTEFDFNVTRCRYAEMYRAMGLADLGAVLSCNRDGAFCEGFDPRLTLERTQTLMGGAAHCDFRYRWSDPD